MMEKVMDEALRALHEFARQEEFAPELAAARAEFFSRVGTPLPGEVIEELRLASLAEWFIFDRELPGRGRTPLEEYLRRQADSLSGDLLTVFQGFSRRLHSIFFVKKRTPHSAILLDLYSGVKYKNVRRLPPSLGRRDLAELRLVPAAEEWFATDAFCYHPYAARRFILRFLKEGRKNGQPLCALLLTLMAHNTRYERLPRTAKLRAYEELVKK